MARWSPRPSAPDADRSCRPASHEGPALLHERDGADGRAVGTLELERQREEPATGGADLIEVGQVLDHRDPGRKENRMRRVLRAAWTPSRLGDRVADAMIRRIVVADGLDAAGDEPFAGARAGPRALFPELLLVDAHAPGPVRAQQHDVAPADVAGAPLEVGRGDLAVGPEVREIDDGRVADPLIDRHRGHIAPVDQIVERRVDMRVGVTADRQHRALQRMAGRVRGHQLGYDLPAEVLQDRKAKDAYSHHCYRSATSTETGKP